MAAQNGIKSKYNRLMSKPHKVRFVIHWLCSSFLLFFRRLGIRCRGVHFGNGLILEGKTDITNPQNVRIGDFVKLGKDVVLGAWEEGHLSIGNNTYIGRWTIILAHQSVTIGNDCSIAPGCHITDVNHGTASGRLIRKQALISKPIRIGNDVWIGAGCSILPGVTIGEGAVIGARSVVTHDVPPQAVAVGSPAKVLRYRTD